MFLRVGEERMWELKSKGEGWEWAKMTQETRGSIEPIGTIADITNY